MASILRHMQTNTKKSKFAVGLEDVVQSAILNYDANNPLEQVELIRKYIKDKTNINVTQFILDSSNNNAHVSMPISDIQHKYIIDRFPIMRGYKQPDEYIEDLNIDRFKVGKIDLTNFKVSGYFSEVPFTIGVSENLINKNHKRFVQTDPFEITGIILHEIGHIISYFMMINQTINTNDFVSVITRETLGSTPKEIYGILSREDVNGVLDLTDKEKKELSEVSDADIRSATILSRSVRYYRHELDGVYYDARNFEVMADHLANRNGVHVEITTGLLRLSGKSSVVKIINQKREEICSGINAFQSGLKCGAIPKLLHYISVHREIYDRLDERFTKIRLDLIDILKDTGLNANIREEVLNELVLIEIAIKNVTPNVISKAIENFFLSLSPGGRHVKKNKALNKMYESLLNNKLYIKYVELLNKSN